MVFPQTGGGVIQASIQYTAGSNVASVQVTTPATGASVYYRTSTTEAWKSGSSYTASDTVTVYFKVEAKGYTPKGRKNDFGIKLTRTASGYSPNYITDPTSIGGVTHWSTRDACSAAIIGAGYVYNGSNSIAWLSAGPWGYVDEGATSFTAATGTSHAVYTWSGEEI